VDSNIAGKGSGMIATQWAPSGIRFLPACIGERLAVLGRSAEEVSIGRTLSIPPVSKNRDQILWDML
jgi:hypothetical protein